MDKAQATELYDALRNAALQMEVAFAGLVERVGEESDETKLRAEPDLRVIAEASSAAMQKLARAVAHREGCPVAMTTLQRVSLVLHCVRR